MPSYTMLNVKLQRESNSTPWGFRMQGGKDFSSPLQIQKINPSSLADRCGIQANDYIVKIGQISCENLKHQDAQECIKEQNNLLELTLQRGAPPDRNDYNSQLEFPPHQLMQSQQNNFSPQPQYRPPPQPPTPQIAMPMTNNRAMLSQAHNTPIGLYSAENVTDAITRTMKSSPTPPFRPQTTLNTRNGGKAPVAVLTSSDVEGLQQKYLSMDEPIDNKSETRQGPAFRALVRGLDGSNSTDQPSSESKPNNQQVSTTQPIKGFRYTQNPMNVESEYKLEQPANFNEFKASAIQSMPKPAPVSMPYVNPQPQPQHQYSQPRPPPFVAAPTPRTPPPVQPKPSGANVPSFNVNIQATPRSGNRVVMKGAKGSASLNQNSTAGQIAICHTCGIAIRGPFISAIGRAYCPDHFTCSNCSVNLVECGFVEENGKLYCERDFEQFLAPHCDKCSQAILKECVHALEKTWHPECFICTACKKSIGTGSFHVEEGEPYCIEDYRRMFQAKCTGCDFPIEPGDKYLEALGGTYHVECFNCSMCQVSLDGQPFVVKNNRPYCRQHGR